VFRLRLIILVVIALAWACGGAGPEPTAQTVDPVPDAEAIAEIESLVAGVVDLLAAHPLPADAPLKVTELVRTEHHSVSLVVLREPIEMHHHARHDETVVMLSGAGRLELEPQGGASAIHDLEPGAVVFMRRGDRHSFTPTGDQPAAVLSIMTPPFDGQDRIFAE
jgi:mannose-6-phosphate isomerase-like protein (cupin superfamily)